MRALKVANLLSSFSSAWQCPIGMQYVACYRLDTLRLLQSDIYAHSSVFVIRWELLLYAMWCLLSWNTYALYYYLFIYVNIRSSAMSPYLPYPSTYRYFPATTCCFVVSPGKFSQDPPCTGFHSQGLVAQHEPSTQP